MIWTVITIKKAALCKRPFRFFFVNQLFFAALTFAHLALAAAAMAALPAALIFRFFGAVSVVEDPPFAALTLAHLARWAAAIRALPAADIPPFLGPRLPGILMAGAEVPSKAASCWFRASIWSLMSAACLSCAEVNDNMSFMAGRV
jgi:hypothetical protein